MNEEFQDKLSAQGAEQPLDPVCVRYAIEKLRSEQNLTFGLLGGAVAAMVGAGLWATITVVTNYQIGWMAVGVGVLAGYAIRFLGKGIDKIFGIVGAVEALLGCALGNLLATGMMVTSQEGIPFLDVLSRLNLNVIRELMVATFSPIDLLFYGLAVYTGYKLSFRQLTEQELKRLFPT